MKKNKTLSCGIGWICSAVIVSALFASLLCIETTAIQPNGSKSMRHDEDIVIVEEKIIKDEPTATAATIPVNSKLVLATYLLAITAIVGGCAFFVFIFQSKKEKERICCEKQTEQ